MKRHNCTLRFCLVAMLLWPSLGISAQGPDPITVVFRDGGRVVVKNWAFKYIFGESAKELPGFSYYTPTNKMSRELHVQQKARGVTSELVILPQRLRYFKLVWEKWDSQEILHEVIVVTNDGGRYRFTYWGKGRLFQQNSGAPPFAPIDSFLSSMPHVFDKKIHLVGTVGASGSFVWDFPGYASYGGGRGVSEEMRDMIDEVWFQP